MKILISGGTGLVGSALVEELVAVGHECGVLSRDPRRHGGSSPAVTVHSWDASSVEPLIELVEGHDAVVHLAGESIGAGRWTAAQKRRILDSRVASTLAMTDAISRAKSPPGVFIQASAVGYYGPRDEPAVSESSSPGDDFLAQICQEWESASNPLEALGIRRVVARTGIVLSASGGALPRMALPFKLFAGGPAGSGEQCMPWIHLVDEVRALVFLLEQSEAQGPFNLSAPNPVSNRDFSRSLGKALKRPAFMPAPAFALRLALGEMADLILTGQCAVPTRLLDLGFEFRFQDLDSALRDLY